MRSKINLDVIVEDERWVEEVDFDAIKVAEELKNLAFDFVEHEIAKGKHEILSIGKKLQLNVCLSNDEAVHKLNKEFRGIDKPTNVLSFAQVDEDEFWDSLHDEDESEFGDIILAYETLKREALEKNITVYAHYCHLLVHGFLHILGYDHQNDEEAEEMEGIETDILAVFSIEDPYAEEEEA